MASNKNEADTGRRAPSRWIIIGSGVVLGFAWGTIMWAIVSATGRDGNGVGGWLYIAISMAMIGGGVAAIFGATGARRRGERIGPRFRRR